MQEQCHSRTMSLVNVRRPVGTHCRMKICKYKWYTRNYTAWSSSKLKSSPRLVRADPSASSSLPLCSRLSPRPRSPSSRHPPDPAPHARAALARTPGSDVTPSLSSTRHCTTHHRPHSRRHDGPERSERLQVAQSYRQARPPRHCPHCICRSQCPLPTPSSLAPTPGRRGRTTRARRNHPAHRDRPQPPRQTPQRIAPHAPPPQPRTPRRIHRPPGQTATAAPPPGALLSCRSHLTACTSSPRML